MKLEELRPAKGEVKKNKRVGRGNGSGHGSTSTKGNKGQTARSGGYHKVGFEGGQMPLQRRLPKFGFTNIFKKEFVVVNVSRINVLPNDKEITPEVLLEHGVISTNELKSVKILADGEISKAYTIKAHKFTKTAIEKITKAGGKAEVIN